MDADIAGKAAALVNPNTRSEAEKWLTDLGARLVKVRYLVRGEWLFNSIVNDPETFDACLDMERRRLNATYAIYPFDGKWVLVGGRCGCAKDYPTREAAEMVAIHNG